MALTRPAATRVYWIATCTVLAGAVVIAFRVPADESLGPIGRVLYLHLPAAMNTFLAASVVFVACVAHLGSRRRVWDHLAHAAAGVTVLNATVLLATGMLWSRFAWDRWWTWSPHLAFSLLLWLLYVGYLALRPLIRPPERCAVVSAAYGIVAFLDVPLLYLSANLLPDVHPASLPLSPAMYRVLALWMVCVTMLTAGLIALRFASLRRAAPLPDHADRPVRSVRPAGTPV